MVSVIIPTYNEQAFLPLCLSAIPSGSCCEVLVVDGGSTDGTLAVAQAAGVTICQTTRPHRAEQMNLGAQEARGDVLVFLHADSLLPSNALLSIQSLFSRHPKAVGGCFTMRLDSSSAFLKAVARGGDAYCRITRTLFGDRAIFVRRSAFQAVGGFRTLAIMEEVEFGKRLRRLGSVHILPGPVTSSARKFEREGSLRVLGKILLACAAFECGVSPERIARLYHGRTASDRQEG